MDQRFAVDADRGVGAERLDEQRHPQVAAGLEARVLREDREIGGAYLVKGEELLGERLVLLDVELAGAAAGVGHAEQIEQADDAHVRVDVFGELLHKLKTRSGWRRFSPEIS